ncbi:MAG: NUDIX hydrolase [Nitrospinae bacterium]|nr:NUDIX hydrolase [Nitrospinota bacterium]MBI3815627.1 NUDIX hydrolase [Nitrospinota bacterium]
MKKLLCPKCGCEIREYKNPFPTVDIIIECETLEGEKGIALIFRKKEPRMWAIPGGFVDYGESLEDAAVREAFEETSLKVDLIRQFHSYSDPKRDPRQHNISVVFIAKAKGIPQAADDAEKAGIFTADNLPDELAFDHAKILDDYFKKRY